MGVKLDLSLGKNTRVQEKDAEERTYLDLGGGRSRRLERIV
jgi:hypothetical protein